MFRVKQPITSLGFGWDRPLNRRHVRPGWRAVPAPKAPFAGPTIGRHVLVPGEQGEHVEALAAVELVEVWQALAKLLLGHAAIAGPRHDERGTAVGKIAPVGIRHGFAYPHCTMNASQSAFCPHGSA